MPMMHNHGDSSPRSFQRPVGNLSPGHFLRLEVFDGWRKNWLGDLNVGRWINRVWFCVSTYRLPLADCELFCSIDDWTDLINCVWR